MSMKSSLLSAEETQDMTTIELDLADETSRLRKVVYSEERLMFQDLESENVKTSRGDIHVAIQGDRTKKTAAIVTLHDIGQNHVTCFQSYFCFHQIKPLLHNFTVYHLNFPGQEPYADELPNNYLYPSMEEMADMVEEVFQHFGLKNTICFGVGAGANVFTRLSLKNPKHVECLILINGTISATTWSDWAHEKMACHYLRTKGMTQFTEDYFLHRYFGNIDENSNQDLIGFVRDDLHRIVHYKNLASFVEQNSKRNAIKLVRPVSGQNNSTLKSGVLILTGDRSPALEDSVNFNSKLDPSNSTWIKLADTTSMVLEEQPTSATNAIVLFLQGYGHAMKVRPPALSFVSRDEEEVHVPAAIC